MDKICLHTAGSILSLANSSPQWNVFLDSKPNWSAVEICSQQHYLGFYACNGFRLHICNDDYTSFLARSLVS